MHKTNMLYVNYILKKNHPASSLQDQVDNKMCVQGTISQPIQYAMKVSTPQGNVPE